MAAPMEGPDMDRARQAGVVDRGEADEADRGGAAPLGLKGGDGVGAIPVVVVDEGLRHTSGHAASARAPRMAPFG